MNGAGEWNRTLVSVGKQLIGKKEPALPPTLFCLLLIPRRHFIHGDGKRLGLDPSRFPEPCTVQTLIVVLPGLAMIEPFGHAIKPGPQGARES